MGGEDLDALVFGLRKAREVLSTEPLASLVDWDQGILTDDITDWDDDEQLKAHVRANCTSTWHYSCTCCMGNLEVDGDAVCDGLLRVGGGEVAGLRVADASVMPQVTSGNTNALSVMIGNKAGEILLHQHLRSGSSATVQQEEHEQAVEVPRSARL